MSIGPSPDELRASRLITDLREQIAAAEAAGVDEEDACIAVPAGYLTMRVGCWPVVDLEFERVALVTLDWAKGLLEGIETEAGWRPAYRGPAGGWGLWQLSPMPSIKELLSKAGFTPVLSTQGKREENREREEDEEQGSPAEASK